MSTLNIKKIKIKRVNVPEFMADFRDAVEDAFYTATTMSAIKASENVPVWTGMAKAVYLGQVYKFDGTVTDADSLNLRDSSNSVDISGNVKYGVTFKPKNPKKYIPFYGRSKEIRTIEGGSRRSRYRFKSTPLTFRLLLITTVVHFLKFDKSKWGSVKEFKHLFTLGVRNILKFTKPKLRDYTK